jgi:xylulokinase
MRTDMTITIGLDVGTSAVKAVLVGAGQTVLAETSEPLTTERPQPGWSEQDPDAWWRAAKACLAVLRAAVPKAYAAVTAIGLSGQMHGLVALDAHDQPVHRAILWNDARARAECDRLTAAVPELAMIAGIIAMPGLTAPKLMWLQRHRPHVYQQIRRLVLPKDYVRLHLTGETATDMADAAGTLWLDQHTRNWSGPIMTASGAELGWMPRLIEGNAVSGTLRPALAAELGLPNHTIVAGGAGDAAAGGIGIGFVADGDAYLSLGTSAQLFVTTSAYRPAPSTLIHAFAHGLPDRWFQMAAMLNGASPLQIMADLVSRSDIDALLDAVVARYAPAEAHPCPLLFLPYLAGERTPHNNADARGVLFGVSGSTTQADIIQAVLEGVAFSLADARDCLRDAGSPITTIGAVGGGTRSAWWMQIIADVLGVAVTRFHGSDKGPAFGAARLAIMAATGASPASVATKPAIRDVFEPRDGPHRRYADTHQRFRSLYQALRPEFDRAARPSSTETAQGPT